MTLDLDTSWSLIPDEPQAAIPPIREYLGRLSLLAAQTQAGAVTSVLLAGPGIFAFPTTPATGAASITFSLAQQTQNRVWASPDGSTGTPAFRALVAADLPTEAARTDQANALTGDQTVTAGNVIANTAGKGLQVKEGGNARLGQAVLVAGAKVVGNTSVTASTRILLTVATPGGTQGHLSYSLNAGVGFTITSTDATETSTVTWLLVEPA